MTHEVVRQGDEAVSNLEVRQRAAGSENVLINNRPAMRMGDGGPDWTVVSGAPGVFVNSRSIARRSDAVVIKDSSATFRSASANVFVGNFVRSSPSIKPCLRVRLADVFGSPLSGEEIEVHDAKGVVIYRGFLDANGRLFLDHSIVGWGVHSVHLADGRRLKIR